MRYKFKKHDEIVNENFYDCKHNPSFVLFPFTEHAETFNISLIVFPTGGKNYSGKTKSVSKLTVLKFLYSNLFGL